MKHLKTFENFSVKKGVLEELLKTGSFTTKNPEDLAGLYINIKIDREGRQIGVSDLPELKGKEWLYTFDNNTYNLKEI